MAVRYRMDGPGRDLTEVERADFRYMLMRTPQARHFLEKGWSEERIRATYEREVLPRMKAQDFPDEEFVPEILDAIERIREARLGISHLVRRRSFSVGDEPSA